MIKFRDMLDTDRRFVVDAWASSFRTAKTAGLIAMRDWFDVMIPQIAGILDRSTTRTVVAFESAPWAADADIYGFVSIEVGQSPPYVFFVYSKQGYRHRGIARALFGAAGVDPKKPFNYACSTPAVSSLVREGKIPLAKWDPLPARFSERKTA